MRAIAGNFILPVPILLVVLFACAQSLFAADQPHYHRFKSYSVEDGLASSRAFVTVQDQQGLLWFGTYSGISRFDGYSFRNYTRLDPQQFVNGSQFRSLVVAADGSLWAGSFSDGLFFYDVQNDKFKEIEFPISAEDGEAVRVFSLARGNRGRLYIGTMKHGLWACETTDCRPSVVVPQAEMETAGGPARINKIVEDDQNRLWVASHSGLRVYSRDMSLLRHFHPGAQNSLRISSLQVWTMAFLPDARVAIGGYEGINLIDSQELVVISKLNQPYEALKGINPVRSMLLDSYGKLWIGTVWNGLYRFDLATGELLNFPHNPWLSSAVKSTLFWDIFEDRHSVVWLAGDSGVGRYDYLANKFIALGHYPAPHEGLAENKTFMVAGDRTGGYWISTSDMLQHFDENHFLIEQLKSKWGFIDSAISGLQVPYFGTSQGTIFQFDAATKQPKVLFDIGWSADNMALDISEKVMWVTSWAKGVVRIDLVSGKQKRFPVREDGGPRHPFINDIVVAHNGLAWVAHSAGVDIYDKESGKFLPLQSDDATATQEVEVRDLLKDGEHIWASSANGLIRFSPIAGEQKWRALRPAQGSLARKYPVGPMTLDSRNRLWVGTSKGVLVLDIRTGKERLLTSSHGLPLSDLIRAEAVTLANGKLVFRAYDCQQALCAVVFDPLITESRRSEPITIMADLEISGDTPRRLNYPYSKRLSILPGDKVLSFGITSDDYAGPEANRFRYRLKGFDDEWSYSEANNKLVYTKLQPGAYELQVSAHSPWGGWQTEPSIMKLYVKPAWWQSWWAKSLLVLLAITAAFAYANYFRIRLKRQHAISSQLQDANDLKQSFVEKLEEQVAEATDVLRSNVEALQVKNLELHASQEQALEAGKVKMAFLANMSHDLRTPLTGISGYINLLQNTELRPQQADYLATLKRAADNLVTIVNDLLDVSKLDAGKMTFANEAFNMRTFLQDLLLLLTPVAYRKGIDLQLIVDSTVPEQVRGDPGRLGQIITNLVGNAIKFTDEGQVSIGLAASYLKNNEDVVLNFRISDTGVGIPEDAQGKIFGAFSQADVTIHGRFGGTGLGLVICKKLLTLMGGDISLESELGAGSTFLFQFSLPRLVSDAPDLPPLGGVRVGLVAAADSIDEISCRLAYLGANVVDPDQLADCSLVIYGMSHRDKLLEHLAKGETRVPIVILAPSVDHRELEEISKTNGGAVCIGIRQSDNIWWKTILAESRGEHALMPEISRRKKPAEAINRLHGMRLLIADDNDIVRYFLVQTMSLEGAEVVAVEDGLAALEAVRGDKFDAVLTDTQMPGMDGLALTRAIRADAEVFGKPLIVGVSANIGDEARKAGEDAGMDAYLTKPASADQLVAALKKALF